MSLTLNGVPVNAVVQATYEFAKDAHEAVGQLRKYTNDPYIVHPVEVAEILHKYGFTDNLTLQVALLHDVLEDTKVTAQEIEDVFGVEVRELVVWLTDVSKPEDGNRATRKAIDREHLAAAPALAQTIKLADLMSNTVSIATHSREFAKVYLPEKAKLLEVLTKADPGMQAKAQLVLIQSQAMLQQSL